MRWARSLTFLLAVEFVTGRAPGVLLRALGAHRLGVGRVHPGPADRWAGSCAGCTASARRRWWWWRRCTCCRCWSGAPTRPRASSTGSSGWLLLVLVLGFALTGYVLPWDQKGYWAKLVETSIVGDGAAGGPLLETGGPGRRRLRQLHRHPPLHAARVRAAGGCWCCCWCSTWPWCAATADAALVADRRRGQPARPQPSGRPGVPGRGGHRHRLPDRGLHSCWPSAAPSWRRPADPASGYQARPEWYALPLYQLRKYFEGPLELLVTLVIPGVVAGWLAALPFLDRGPDRARRSGWPVLVLAGLGLAGLGALAACPCAQGRRRPGVPAAPARGGRGGHQGAGAGPARACCPRAAWRSRRTIRTTRRAIC